MAFTAAIFTKLTTAQHRYTEISYTEFHPNWSRNKESMGRNAFMPEKVFMIFMLIQ
jgi:hypothetical protein